MKPGPELDSVIHEKVMGLPTNDDFCDCIHYGDGDSVPRYNYDMENDACLGCLSPRIKSYSTYIDHAMGVWEYLNKHKKLDFFYSELVRHDEKDWTFRNHTDEGLSCVSQIEGFGTSAPHAICLAALKAKGVEL